MGSPDKKLLGIVNFWGPRKCEPTNVSRVFWMPDQSCRVCYECDSQFTVFNRRHHCRLCGRVFCAKCTAHSIPILSDESKSDREDSDRIRVCNYCFRQWEQGLVTDNHETGGASSPGLSPSPSAISLGSLNTSFTGDSIASTVNSMAYSTGPYEHVTYGSSTNLEQSSQSGQHNQNNGASDPISINTYVDVGDLSSNDNQYGLCVNRSDDEENANGGYFGAVNFDEIDNMYRSCKGAFDGEGDDRKAVSPLSSVVFGSEFLEGIKASGNEPGIPNTNDESEASLYGIENADADNLDFENNGLLWIPPEPEDEDEDREADLFDDEDDIDGAGEWGYQSSSSSLAGELQQREKANEEHRKAMRNVVGGHFRALITQLLQVENLPVRDDDDKESWLDIITSLSWEAASLLKPDMTKGSGMDPGGYVKVKCLACGKRSNSLVVKGVVCKKNVAHRRMTAKFDRPRLLILGGALEYQRVSTHLSSFDTLLQQEMEHLKMAVHKISSHNPNILLVEKSVSRFAQEYLLERNISLVLNIKRPLLERIARCSGTQIVPSVDHLKSQSQTLGYCESFHVDKYFEEHGSADQGGKKLTKTLMFFEGCPKPLGCTILLKGASGDELKKVKHVVQYGIFAAYHLALETSYLADEGASLPELPLKSPITVALPDKPLNINRSISTVSGLVIPPTERPQSENSRLVSHVPSLITTSTVPLSERNQSSSLNEYMESSLNYVLSTVDSSPDSSLYDVPNSIGNDLPQDGVSEHVSKLGAKQFPENHSISVKPDDCLHVDYAAASSFSTSVPSGHSVCKRNDDCSPATEPNASTNLLDSNYGEQNEKVKLLKEEFPPSPSDGHSILVSLTTRCVWKGVVCERAHLFRIKYYRSFDKPLGRFLLDDLFDQNYCCRVCEMPSEAHIHCYTHQQGSLTISVRKLTEFPLPGEREGKIWMWHRCLRCPRVNGFPPATRRIVMSDAAWGLSFGKFLELSFSNHAAASRVASCGHSLHKDCLRFYGCGRMVACFRYAPIVVNSVFLPPSNLEFTCANLEWIQIEADEVNDQAELLYTEVCNCINEISEKFSRSGLPESNIKACRLRKHIMELDKILRKEKEEFEESLQKALQLKRQDGIDTLEINRLRLHLLIQSYVWDQRLIEASSLDAKITQYESDSSILKSMEETCNYVEKTNTNAGGDVATEVDNYGSVISDGKIGKDLSQGVNIKEFNKMMCKEDLHGINMGEADPANSVNAVQRISAGQFPIGVNLSDTLDAAWIGEILSGTAKPKENDAIDPSNSVRSVAASPSSEKHNDARDETEIHHAASNALPPKSSDFLDSSTDWLKMSFMNIYQYTARNAQKLDALWDYNPVFVSSFRELKRLGGARLLLPVGVDHTVIPVYDDEPTSIIAYALVSPDYKNQISDDPEMKKDGIDSAISLTSLASSLSLHPFEAVSGSMKSFGSSEESLLSMSGSRNSLILDPLFYTKALHARVSFSDNGPLGKVKYTVTCYYAKRFEALRKICCPSEMDFIRSLSRCKKWGAQGGKSNVFFAKSLDDRFIIKQVTKTELESFIKFAPAYFKYLSESIESCSPTCLAKILGIYQCVNAATFAKFIPHFINLPCLNCMLPSYDPFIDFMSKLRVDPSSNFSFFLFYLVFSILNAPASPRYTKDHKVTSKHIKGGKEFKMDVLVMENLLFRRNVVRLYDLKGSCRSRYNPDSTGGNKVLLDQNLIETMPTSPIFVGNKAKRLLERAVWNDTSFLASIDVMDYSLLVGIDEEKRELVVGIIDFMRQYTWDKHLETWVKASGILGGPKNAQPTVISPDQYKKRFRKAMTTYFLMVPDQWSPPTILPSEPMSDVNEEN